LPLGNDDAVPEGESRRRNRELAAMCKYVSYVTQWYVAHVGRGMWKEAQLQQHKQKLQLPEMQGRVGLFIIDHKSKTVPDKHRAEQGFGIGGGGNGMSVQGGMLNYWQDGKMQQHYVDVIYDQSSTQRLEESMTSLSAQLDFIRRIYPDLETIG
jgi:hypothetical protein